MKCFFTVLIYSSKEGEGIRRFKIYADCSQYEKDGALIKFILMNSVL